MAAGKIDSAGLLLGLGEFGFHLLFDVRVERGVGFEGFFGPISALSELVAVVAEPTASFLDDVVFQGEVLNAGGEA